MTPAQKVTAHHLKRQALIYVRQSTLRQVVENVESTRRQYALGEKARALGWTPDQIVVIDSDLGQSGASTVDREGFQRLVTEVGMGRVGIVLGLEVSRLARNCSDWHQLLEICALTSTLILDADGLYDPRHFNDRLLLGMKGTMSEAELHILKARLHGGILNKARRGEYRTPLPIGLIYADGKVALEPDRQIQDAVRAVFRLFHETGSGRQTAKAFRRQGLKFPSRAQSGASRGEVTWRDLTVGQVRAILRNPRYAGVFYYGRRQGRPGRNGRFVHLRVPVEDWHVLLPEAHAGYITWDEFQDIQRRLKENAIADGHAIVREGPALLQGLAVCGACGRRMGVRYQTRKSGQLMPYYYCQGDDIERCQSIPGTSVDEAVGNLLIEAVSPMALEAALAVQAELDARAGEADRLRGQQVERAAYEAELARRRYMKVDPENRLVAASLEDDWNARLRGLQEAQNAYERHRQRDHKNLSADERQAVLDLATDFPRLWRDARVPSRERKRIVRLLIEDVTVTRSAHITVNVRFKGGVVERLTLPLPLSGGQQRKTDPAVIALIDTLLPDKSYSEIASELNQRGYRSGYAGRPFDGAAVASLRDDYGLESRYQRLREKGYLTATEVARCHGVCLMTVYRWRAQGRLHAVRYADRDAYLYEATLHPASRTADPT